MLYSGKGCGREQGSRKETTVWHILSSSNLGRFTESGRSSQTIPISPRLVSEKQELEQTKGLPTRWRGNPQASYMKKERRASWAVTHILADNCVNR